jgi:hypothetical protein
LFHYSQSIYRKILNLGWSDQYKNDKQFAKRIRRFISMSLLRLTDVTTVYELLMQKFEDKHGE